MFSSSTPASLSFFSYSVFTLTILPALFALLLLHHWALRWFHVSAAVQDASTLSSWHSTPSSDDSCSQRMISFLTAYFSIQYDFFIVVGDLRPKNRRFWRTEVLGTYEAVRACICALRAVYKMRIPTLETCVSSDVLFFCFFWRFLGACAIHSFTLSGRTFSSPWPKGPCFGGAPILEVVGEPRCQPLICGVTLILHHPRSNVTLGPFLTLLLGVWLTSELFLASEAFHTRCRVCDDEKERARALERGNRRRHRTRLWTLKRLYIVLFGDLVQTNIILLLS